MENLTIGLVIGAGLKAGFSAIFKTASDEVTTLGKTLKDLESQRREIGKVFAAEDRLAGLGQDMQAATARVAAAQNTHVAAKATHESLTGAVKAARVEVAAYAAAVADTQRPTAEQLQGLVAARERLAGLEIQYASSGNALRNSRNDIKAAERSVASLTDKQTKQTTVIGESIEALRQRGVETGNLRQAEQQLGAAIAETQARLESEKELMARRSAALSEIGSQWLKLGGAIRVIKRATASAIDLESAMADVRKVVDFDTPEQFAQMGAGIGELSGRLPMAADGIAAIVAAGGQAGIARDELLGFAEAAAKMGVAFDVTADKAGELMANWRTSFSMGQDAVGVLADQINYLGNTGTVNAKSISEIVTRIGTLGDVAGIGAAQVAAIGATLNGIAPETAATGIKRLLLVLNSGSAATGEQQKAFKSLGLSATDLAQAMQDDAAGAIITVMERIQALDPTEQTAALQELFGSGSVEAIAPLLGNLERLRENLGKVADATRYAGSMEAEYAARAATTDNNLQLMRNQIGRVAAAIGNVFLPPLNLAASIIGTVAGGIANVAGQFPGLTAVVVGSATGFLFWKTAVASAAFASTFLPPSILKLIPAFPVLSTVLNLASTSALGFGAALMSTPIGWVIAGIAGVVAAGVLLWKYWQPIKAFFVGVFQGIGESLAPLRSAFSSAFGPAMPMLSALGGLIGDVVGWFKALLTPVQSSAEGIESAAEAGRGFGHVLGSAAQFAMLPLTALLALIGKVMTGMSSAATFAGKIGSMLGFGGDDTAATPAVAGATGGRALAAEASINRVAAASPAATGRAGTNVSQSSNYQIAVHAAPGMDEQAVAAQVRRQLDDRDRQNAARQRGSLYDRD